MEKLSTKELTEELSKREGITTIRVAPYELVEIKTGQGTQKFTGPAIILINQD